MAGIGFRMAQELGFQKDPKLWISHDESITTLEDLEIRRRIYWGCYISDKLISLILGRPGHLGYGDGEVDLLETQVSVPTPPFLKCMRLFGKLINYRDPPYIVPWRSVGFDDDSEGNNSMVPYIKEQIKLSRIIEKIIGTLFHLKPETNDICRRHTLDGLNLELCAWKEQLPPWADFNRWDSITQPLKPSLAALQYGIIQY